ncbi:hypothetical protein MTO96_026128 [Rhipicephalus appendiculatus]
MCLEIVRLAPTSPLPFQTLAMIYEELRDPSRALQFGLIAAYLGPQDSYEWGRLAHLCLDQGLVRKAASCLVRALMADPHDLELRRLLCALYEQLGDEPRALVSCAVLARRIEEPAECLQLSRLLVDVFRKRQNLPSAVRVLLNAATKFPAHISAEDINMLLEMQLTLKMHSAALLVLHEHCGVQLLPLPEGHEEISAELLEDSLDAFERCLVPVDLRELKREVDPEKSGDLLLNVAEAFMDADFENDALPLLRMLVRTRNYGTAAVWLRYAECLQRLGHHQDATKAYERTCELAPRHAPSRLSLGQLLAAQGLRDKAIDCLATDSRHLQDTKDSTPEQQQDSASVLLCQARLLWDSGPREAFIESAMTLVRAHCLSVCTTEEYEAVYSNTYHLSRMKVLRELHEKRGFTPGWLTMESGVCVDELQACFLELYRALQESGRMDELRQVATEVLVAPMFNRDTTSTEELEFLSFLAHYQDPDHVEHSFPLIRSMVLKYPNQHALAEYTQLLAHLGEEEPMLLLCSGICLVRLAGLQLSPNQNSPVSEKPPGSQKFPEKYYWLATQGMAFLIRYLRARGSDCQEALFNVGRALHELGFLHIAFNLYQRALAAAPAVQEVPEVFDLRREIAFNLSLLYKLGGNNEMADWCINHYCVV